MNRKHRKAIIAGNWKMNLVPSEIKPFADELRELLPKTKTCEVVLMVPFTHISTLRCNLKGNRISFGAQDVSIHERGAYTGEVSAEILADMKVRYVIVGHSECRQYHGDSDFTVGEKAAVVLEKGMSPIICVGETVEQRERGITMEHISYQVLSALSFIPKGKERQIVFAYEPIWAIGTGKTASKEEAEKVCKDIRAVIRNKRGANAARSISILYGGSMNPKNAKELLSIPDIDGGLIGGASLKPKDFAQIIDAVTKVNTEHKN